MNNIDQRDNEHIGTLQGMQRTINWSPEITPDLMVAVVKTPEVATAKSLGTIPLTNTDRVDGKTSRTVKVKYL